MAAESASPAGAAAAGPVRAGSGRNLGTGRGHPRLSAVVRLPAPSSLALEALGSGPQEPGRLREGSRVLEKVFPGQLSQGKVDLVNPPITQTGASSIRQREVHRTTWKFPGQNVEPESSHVSLSNHQHTRNAGEGGAC